MNADGKSKFIIIIFENWTIFNVWVSLHPSIKRGVRKLLLKE